MALAALLLGGNELAEKKHLFKKTFHHVDRWLGVMVPYLLSLTTLISGAVLLFSGATPTVPDRLSWLHEVLSLPVIELSHFLGSLIGVCLLLLARGLQRRIDAAYTLLWQAIINHRQDLRAKRIPGENKGFRPPGFSVIVEGSD